MHEKMKSQCFLQVILPLMVNIMMASSERVLLLPFPWPSHYHSLDKIGVELEGRGHEVNMVMPSNVHYKGILNTTTYEVPELENATFVGIAENRLESGSGFGVSWLIQYVSLLKQYGMVLMQDMHIAKLARNADLVLSDTALLFAPVFADYYKLPMVFISPFGHLPGWVEFGNIENPSYVPTFLGTSSVEKIAFPQRMNFLQRSYNLLANIMGKLVTNMITVRLLRPLTQEYSSKALLDLWRETAMILIPMDYSLEYPRPDPPHVKMIGPLLTCNQPKPLAPEFRDIIQKSPHEIIVASFGVTSSLHKQDLEQILNSLLKLKYTVIWKYSQEKLKKIFKNDPTKSWIEYACDSCTSVSPEVTKSYKSSKQDTINKFSPHRIHNSIKPKAKNLLKFGGNVYVFDWLPQQGLLHENKTVLLMTHCGTNSVYEALYHNTQVLCLPLFGDHFENAGRVVSRNVGRAITLREMPLQNLQSIIQNLLNDHHSKNNVAKISKRLRKSKESAAKKAAKWIELVLEEKGDMAYLRPVGADLPYHVYFCMDVIVFWVAVFVVLPSLSYYQLFKVKDGAIINNNNK